MNNFFIGATLLCYTWFI